MFPRPSRPTLLPTRRSSDLISSLGAREELNQAMHGWGGIVFHDVINQKFAHKAIEKGADGLILVAAGAGGHAGTIDRKSTRLNSSHQIISYAVFCLKKKKCY